MPGKKNTNEIEEDDPETLLRVDPSDPYAVLGPRAQNLRNLMINHHEMFAKAIMMRMMTLDETGEIQEGLNPFTLLTVEELSNLQGMLLAEIAQLRDWLGMNLTDAAHRIAANHQIKAAFAKVRKRLEEEQKALPPGKQQRGAGLRAAGEQSDVSKALAGLKRPKGRNVSADRVPSDVLKKQIDSS